MMNLTVHYLPYKVWLDKIKVEHTTRIATGLITDAVALELFRAVFCAPIRSYGSGHVYEAEQARVVIANIDHNPPYGIIKSLQDVEPGILDRTRHIEGSLIMYTFTPADDVMHGIDNNMFMLLRVQARTVKRRYNMESLSPKAKAVMYGETVS